MSASQHKRRNELRRMAARSQERRQERRELETRWLDRQQAELDTAPVLDCFMDVPIETRGMASVLISRRLSDGSVAVSVFLVDVFCLGVKDAFFRVLPRSRYHQLRERIAQREMEIDLSPEDAVGLVQGAVDYARRLGIAPHPDFETARRISAGSIPARRLGSSPTARMASRTSSPVPTTTGGGAKRS